MIHLVTFATPDMERSGATCVKSAMQNGINQSRRWHLTALEHTEFCRDNQRLLKQPRGVGYWAWKPFIILESMGFIPSFDPLMSQVRDGDILIYSDAGVEFINNVSHIIDRMDQDIFLFGNNWEHAHWCKRDIVESVWPLTDSVADSISRTLYIQGREVDDGLLSWQRFGKQVQASVIFFRVSDYSRKFVKEWLDWCLFEGGRLIDDSPSRTPNHPEFQENRHDQAILTTMAYRDGIKLHWWPAIYNDGQFTYEKLPVYAGDDYPPIFHHHRRRNHEWSNAA